MRLIFLLFIAALPSQEVKAQSTTPAQLELGKGRLLHRKEVSTENYGRSWSSGYFTFFRITPSGPWKRTGFLGKRLTPYLTANPQAMIDFRHYRRAKWGATGCYTGLIITGVCTTTVGGFFLISGGDKKLGSIFLVGLASSIGLEVSNRSLNRRADRHLQHAVQTYNGISTSDTQAPAKEWQLCLRPTAGHTGLGLSLTMLLDRPKHHPSSFIVQSSSL